MSAPRLPAGLRAAVDADRRAVHPLPAPGVRALEVALWAVVALLAAPALFGLRGNAAAIGFFAMWGAAVGECLAGVLLVALALREAIPGSGVGRGRALAALVAGFAVQAAVAWLTSMRLGSMPEGGHHPGATCLAMESSLALPALAATLWLVVRALPVRPRWSGALGGLGAGLMADGVWHLVCPMCDLHHVLVWHGGATAVMTALGWGLGALWERRQLARIGHLGAGPGAP